MSKAVEQRRGQLLVAEDLHPLAEREVGRDDRRAPLVAVGEEVEQQLAAGALEGHEAELVDDQQRDPQVTLVQPRERELVARLDQLAHEVGRAHEGDAVAAAYGLDAECDREVRLAGADRPGDHDVLGAFDVLTGRELGELRAASVRCRTGLAVATTTLCAAAVVPPPHELVDELLFDLSASCHDGSLPAVTRVAIAHAQFETIHPFVDGNGRTGRAIHLVLRRRGLAPCILPPVSLSLATWPRDYVGGLAGTRYEGAPDCEEALAGINRWIALVARACRRVAEDAGRFEEQLSALQDSWRERLGSVRRGSAADLLVRTLPGAPLLTATTASDLIGRSFQATSHAIDRLLEAGIL